MLIFVGAPVAIIAVITLAVLGPSQLRAQSRYRPGRPWSHTPAWFIPHFAESAVSGSPAIAASVAPDRTDASSAGASTSAAVGGASGEW